MYVTLEVTEAILEVSNLGFHHFPPAPPPLATAAGAGWLRLWLPALRKRPGQVGLAARAMLDRLWDSGIGLV